MSLFKEIGGTPFFGTAWAISRDLGQLLSGRSPRLERIVPIFNDTASFAFCYLEHEVIFYSIKYIQKELLIIKHYEENLGGILRF